MYKKALAPIVDDSRTILIMGTIPGEQSIKKQQYYGNNGNHFWKILFSIFEEDFDSSYEKRKALLQKNGIALWNVLASCKREGSSDAKIKEEEINDFESFHKQYPNIKYVFFESKAAENYFNKHTKPQPGITYKTLPSTSGLNARFTLVEKTSEWKIVSKIASLQ